MSALVLADPTALAWLGLPLGLLLLSALPGRVPDTPTGTLELWRRVADRQDLAGDLRRRRVPLWLALLCAGLTALALAAAEPTWVGAPVPRTFDVVVEPGAALTLPWIGDDGVARGTRFERAAERLAEELAEDAGPGDRIRWHLGVTSLESALEAAPPFAAGELLASAEVDWIAWDRAGIWWLRSERPASRPAAASWVASGGAAVPGLVDRSAEASLHWDGAALERLAPDEPAPALAVDVPAPWSDFAEAYGAARGLRVVAAGADPLDAAVLHLSPIPAGDDLRGVRAGRDGWSIDYSGPSGAPASDGTADWLVAGARTLVSWRPGEVRVASGQWSEPIGDPAAFALAAGRLLDRARLPAPGCAPLAARLDRGPAGVGRGAAAPGGESRERLLAGWPAGIGALLLAAAATAIASRSGLRPSVGPGARPDPAPRSGA